METIGSDFEFIVIDNLQKNWSIAKAYNYGARQAKYPYLFFVHEDVKFHSTGWGRSIAKKMSESDCGVIGFAGSKIRIDCFAGWCQAEEYNVMSIVQRLPDGRTEFQLVNANHPFEEVVTLDGLGLFVKRDVWLKYPFDEDMLRGFHCYDIDFTLQIASVGLKNYVCCLEEAMIEHFSLGNFDRRWFLATMNCHKKWKSKLPMKTQDVILDHEKRMLYEENFSYDFLKRIFVSDASRTELWLALKEFWKRPMSKRHLRCCMSYTIKFILKK